MVLKTARDNEIDRVVGLEIGADDYVVKPFSPREVVARVRVILRRYQVNLGHLTPDERGMVSDQASGALVSQGRAVRVVGNFELDGLGARIKFCGMLLVLTRYEYLLLKMLIEHPERVFSRAQLMELVWVDALDTLDRTVDAHVKCLRSKLRDIDASFDPIKTHRGLGYSLSPRL
jgi:two-component system, OmpR family, catabolic regulation response regulator CreB